MRRPAGGGKGHYTFTYLLKGPNFNFMRHSISHRREREGQDQPASQLVTQIGIYIKCARAEVVKETWTFGRSLRHSQLLSEHWPFGPENTPSGVATSVLAQVVSASSAERNWSVYGQIKPKNRSRTGHDTSNKRVYAHEALHLRV